MNRESADVGEVARLGAIEQRKQLAACELLRIERRPERAHGRRATRHGIHGQVDRDLVDPVADNEAAVGRTLVDGLDGPAETLGFRAHRCDSVDDRAAPDEHVEVAGRACGQPLGDERGAAGQEEALRLGEGEECPSDRHLERREHFGLLGAGHAAASAREITGAHAERTSCGKTSSPHRSRSSAPSM